MRQSKKAFYRPLEATFLATDGTMPLYRFAAIEAVLHLLSLCAPDADPQKAYLLFAQYQLIGTTACSPIEHILQCARYELGYYRSQKNWQDDLRAYRDPRYAAFRAFAIQEKEGKLTFARETDTYPYAYEARKKEWEQFWTERDKKAAVPARAKEGVYQYTRISVEDKAPETVTVTFSGGCATDYQQLPPEKGCRPPLSISWQELLHAAYQMSQIQSQDPCYKILRENILKQVEGTSVQLCTTFTIHEVVNMVGMVGSGKSTLMKVLAFWCHCHGYRMVLVVDTVAEVLSLQRYLSAFGIFCSPLIGRNERMKYIDQVAAPKKTCLPAVFSQYLTPACLVDGMDARHSTSLAFGKEPCYALQKGQQHCLCPYFERCSGTKMLRECYEASVVITTVAGFAVSRVGQNRETFLELAMRDFDLVVFDECDRVQKTLDDLFMPETSFDNYISESSDEYSAYMRLSSKRREENPAVQRYSEMQGQGTIVSSRLIKSLRRELGPWGKIAHGDLFSALHLLEDLYRTEGDYQIPRSVYDAFYRLIDRQSEETDRRDALWAALDSSCRSTDETLFEMMYRSWLEEMGTEFPRPEKDQIRRIQDARLQLILKLIYFDHYIRDLSDAYEASHETAYGQKELFGFLQMRFRQQQYFLPSALCGNLFGLKKTENEDIILFRQFAFGRSLMKDLPYLCTDREGKPAGPHAILLSGSSWAEGSYEYHINRPVRYILEADSKKRTFLERTRFFESGFPERVSGAAEQDRMERLRAVTNKTLELIVREYQRGAGKILIVVNSYAQARQVQVILNAGLREKNCPARACCMISDVGDRQNSERDERENAVGRRGEVNRFADMREEILIAPAMAIERGHNIVDEYGHSALCAVFFMVRPMAVPDDIQQKGSKLNGLVEAQCKRGADESLFAYNMRVRQFATRQWRKMGQNRSFGLAELEEDEQRDVVATLFILILQIFGRLARVTDVTRPEPHVYFMDGAFRGRAEKPGDFDCLSALGRYLDTLMTQRSSAEIAKTLYAPFYRAYRGGIQYESNLPVGL